ncbi:hypothetical protein GCM10027169_26150 [Gordonia jinhuaensis]|uniref:SIP-like Rossmann fold domain-containing protein n=1 Tax=Gordonia jinhuaensis TaxID=1517702 RepID=A0A916TB86_9ACTN|nr:hypothetical protein GCM10011489_27960 [Gordonia jinhuaensis]
MISTDVMHHERGLLASWRTGLHVGDSVTFSGMRAEWYLPAAVRNVLLIADGSALPAALIEAIPDDVDVQAYVSAENTEDLSLIPSHPHLALERVTSLTNLLHRTPRLIRTGERVQVWIAGETAEVRELRRHAVEAWHVDLGDLIARAYWKAGVTSTEADAQRLPRFVQAVSDGADLHDPALAENIDLELSA